RRYAQFPIILETYRECLRDVLDVPGLRELLRALHARELSLVEVETPTASPFASSLLFDYVATYMYEGDTPNAERRAAALSLDRELLRELLGQEELRELIDPQALAEVEDSLQHRSEPARAKDRDALQQILRRLGDLTPAECEGRVAEGYSADSMLPELERAGALIRGELLPGGSEREWCDPDVLRRVRRASLAHLRAEAEAVDPRELARFLPSWQNVDAHRPAGAGPDRLREALVPLQGV